MEISIPLLIVPLKPNKLKIKSKPIPSISLTPPNTPQRISLKKIRREDKESYLERIVH
jgi:hypothetical protein